MKNLLIESDHNKEREILSSVTQYQDFEEFEKYNNIDKEEFKSKTKDNYIQDITLGLFIGANLNKFIPRDINSDHILQAIYQHLHELDFYNYMDCEEWYQETKEFTDLDWVREFASINEVFTLNGRIYVNQS